MIDIKAMIRWRSYSRVLHARKRGRQYYTQYGRGIDIHWSDYDHKDLMDRWSKTAHRPSYSKLVWHCIVWRERKFPKAGTSDNYYDVVMASECYHLKMSKTAKNREV